ncbi:hypothetical protein SCUP234_04891 [Seiridium cupressi]
MDPDDYKDWTFDVSALMVLISESEELKYRLAGRNLMEALCAAPVAGIQTYLRSYDILLEPSSYSYFSPYGCKSAPLRNLALDNAIKKGGLFENGKCTYLKIPHHHRGSQTELLKLAWAAFTWACMIGLFVTCQLAPNISWIGLTNCLVYAVWSILLRVIEFVLVRPAPETESSITRPDAPDAVFILGRSNSALVISGSRKDVKAWTTRGLIYNQNAGSRRTTSFWQAFTRGGTLLVMMLVFCTIPNGSTMDQVVFILFNVLGQANTLLGLWLNGKSYLEPLEKLPNSREDVPTRTDVYASLIRFFEYIEDKEWINKAGLLPQKDQWLEWKDRITSEPNADPKTLYNAIDDAYKSRARKHQSVESAEQLSTRSLHRQQGDSNNNESNNN